MQLLDTARLAILASVIVTATASGQAWNWGRQLATYTTGGYGTNKVTAIATDPSDNIYLVGDFGDSAQFGATKLKSVSAGADMFVARMNSAGNTVWAKRFGSSYFLDQAIDIVTDFDGNVYVAGAFSGTLDCGGVQVASTATSMAALVKYNSNGDAQWASLIPGVISGPGGLLYSGTNIYVAAGRTLAKFTLDGDTVWTHIMPASSSNTVSYRDIAIDVWGCLLVTGRMTGTLTYGTDVLSTASGTDPDIFVVKFEPDGSFMWARRGGAVSTPGQEDIGHAVATSDHGDVYIVGEYQGKAGFDTDTVNAGSAIAGSCLIKYNSDGVMQWAIGSSGPLGSTYRARGLRVLANNDLLVAGNYAVGVTFPGSIVNISSPADVLCLRINADGTILWSARSTGLITNTYPLCLALNPNRSAAYIGGQFHAAVTFGPNTMSLAGGAQDGFVAQMDVSVATAADDDITDPLPRSFNLSQNYPNPFNPTTTIEYRVPHATEVALAVYNLLGERVRTLVDQPLPAGDHSVLWDGRDDSGHAVASGVYLYRLRVGAVTETRKMTLLK